MPCIRKLAPALATWLLLTSCTPPADRKNGKDEVLLYYVNETDPSPKELNNFKVVETWLRASTQHKVREIADELDHDLKQFPDSVNEVLAAISPLDINYIVVTNHLAKQGRAWVHRRGEPAGPTYIQFPTTGDQNYILESNPLTKTDNFEAYLKIASNAFPPKFFNFVLITKSHGSPAYALTTRISVRNEETYQQEFLSVVEGSARAPLPKWSTERPGISKANYFSDLSQSSRETGAYFSLVFLEACNSDSPRGLSSELRNNVALIAATKTGSPYRVFDYRILQRANDPKISLSELILGEIKQRQYVTIYAPGSWAALWDWRYLYFFPLILLIVLAAIRRPWSDNHATSSC